MTIGVAGLASAASAQTPVNPVEGPAQQSRPGQAVDQAVGDLGPHIKSRRKVEPGLGAFSSETSLYRRFEPVDWQKTGEVSGQPGSSLHLPQPYVYRAPGVRAYVDQPQYLTRGGQNEPAPGPVGNNGQFRQKVTANTVYDLIPRDHPASPLAKSNEQANAAGPIQLNGIGERYRINGRVDGQTQGLIEGRVNGRINNAGEARQAARQKRPPRNDRGQRSRRRATPPAATQPATTQPSPDSRFGPNHPIFRNRRTQSD
jgi:hypothetical protein